MDKICYLYDKYIDNENDLYTKIIFTEEKLIPSISFNLASNNCKPLTLYINVKIDNDINKILTQTPEIFFIKKVDRNININLRKNYNIYIKNNF